MDSKSFHGSLLFHFLIRSKSVGTDFPSSWYQIHLANNHLLCSSCLPLVPNPTDRLPPMQASQQLSELVRQAGGVQTTSGCCNQAAASHSRCQVVVSLWSQQACGWVPLPFLSLSSFPLFLSFYPSFPFQYWSFSTFNPFPFSIHPSGT